MNKIPSTPNMQNLIVHTKLGNETRKRIVNQYSLKSIDYVSIEKKLIERMQQHGQ